MILTDLDNLMASINDLINSLEEADHFPAEIGQAIAEWVILICRDLNKKYTYSEYYISLMRIMALWPVYDIHMYIACEDPTTVREIYLYMEAWKDTYPPEDKLSSEDFWILEKWNNIMAYRNEIESNVTLIS